MTIGDESFEKNHSDIHADANYNNLEFFWPLQLWFPELSWCEALSLKFARPYYVDFSVNSQTGKVYGNDIDSSKFAVLLADTWTATHCGLSGRNEDSRLNHSVI